LDLVTAERPDPQAGEILVQVMAFPLHPRDLHIVAGPYPTGVARLGAGLEATGTVAALGPGVTGFAIGDRVTVFPYPGAWNQWVAVDVARAVPVPDGVSDAVAAQMLVNPITALMLLRAAQRHHSVGFDGIVVNNAAGSSVGRTSRLTRSRIRPPLTKLMLPENN
jgi:NADPH:quinone reductase-like Zn-dependent oxidoreductase